MFRSSNTDLFFIHCVEVTLKHESWQKGNYIDLLMLKKMTTKWVAVAVTYQACILEIRILTRHPVWGLLFSESL
jgi:hypothetical protein